MEKTVSLKQNREFQRVYRKGCYKAGHFLVVYALKNNKQQNRLGITTGKRFGNSVQRNRVRRLIRENYRFLEPAIRPGYDIVILARASERAAATPNNRLKAVSLPDFGQVRQELHRLCKAVGLFAEEPISLS